MKKLLTFLRQYWQFSVAILTLLTGLVSQLLGWHAAAHWVLGTIALLLTIPLLINAWQDFQGGSYGLDLLGLVTIYAAVVFHQTWAAIALVIVLALTRAATAYAVDHTQGSLAELLKHAPTEAHILRGRKTVEVAASKVHRGDKFIVNPGEIVAVDAVIIEGDSEFDESLLTGVKQALHRSVDEQILGGSVNVNSAVTARALRGAADSQYEQIVRLNRTASAYQAPFVRLAAHYALPFTIAALVLGAAAWIISRQSGHFLDVLTVVTSVPLLVGAPLAVSRGLGSASHQGILVRTGAALERLADAETFAFGTVPTEKQLKRFKKLGISQLMFLSTDAAAAKTQKVGFDEIHAPLTASEKLRVINTLTARPVVYVGNGIEDVSALTAADVGMAVGARGSAKAGEPADVIIMQSDMDSVIQAFIIARRAFARARHTIIIGMLCSLILMVIFSTGRLPALVGVVLQGVLNLLVIFNSARSQTQNSAAN